MLFLSSPGGVGIAPTIERSVVIGTDVPLLSFPRFSRFQTNESHIQDRFRTRHALQVLRRGRSNLQDALHDGWLGGDGGRRRVPRT